jgi:hypothetical protein
MERWRVVALSGLAAGCGLCGTVAAADAIPIGRERQLMLDGW